MKAIKGKCLFMDAFYFVLQVRLDIAAAYLGEVPIELETKPERPGLSHRNLLENRLKLHEV